MLSIIRQYLTQYFRQILTDKQYRVLSTYLISYIPVTDPSLFLVQSDKNSLHMGISGINMYYWNKKKSIF